MRRAGPGEVKLYAAELRTWVGEVWVVATPSAVVQVAIGQRPELEAVDPGEGPASLRQAVRQLEEYLRGSRRVFDVPLELRGTPFQRAVWSETSRIPYGSTRTYASVASSLGAPRGARAVGSALAANPVPILVPCHRVVRSDGSPGGYSPSPELKVRLLEFERRNAAPLQ
ncbi:MAG: methylated-DNA--[protein]-cysteine S-methyltransferase [Nitrososphaeria archaeon]|nr:methylated-DNA--[protein]-cysteine S-methyltransferase [Nitrososphaeria archaeon]MDW8043284.1 methylated-DNA--[protein]-cysteine S-methyltransferase [Nitrososphaerota archaeon]